MVAKRGERRQVLRGSGGRGKERREGTGSPEENQIGLGRKDGRNTHPGGSKKNRKRLTGKEMNRRSANRGNF